MRKLRIAATTLILAASLMAFTNAQQEQSKDVKTWYYTLDENVQAKYNNPINYQNTPVQEFPSCGSADQVLCSIEAEDDGTNHPLLDPNIPVTKDGSEYHQTRRAFEE